MSASRRSMMGTRRESAEKSKALKGAIGKLVAYCKPFGAAILIAVICDMLGVITKLIGPNKIKDITNMISEGLTGELDLDGIVSVCIFMIVLYGGEIRIDGVSIADITREAIHDQFGMVLQDTWLFEGTVRENLCYGRENITDAQLDAACRAVGLYHFIKTLPHGYDTMIDDTLNLSAGQKQLMTIARAMIENAPMLILDEATSSVDTRTELLIQKAMDRLTRGRTSFVIAHRLSTIKNADKILVLKDGDIVESGDHESLLAQNGFYAALYNSQFEVA